MVKARGARRTGNPWERGGLGMFPNCLALGHVEARGGEAMGLFWGHERGEVIGGLSSGRRWGYRQGAAWDLHRLLYRDFFGFKASGGTERFGVLLGETSVGRG